MKTLVICDNLTNDYCHFEPQFLMRRVNIGEKEIERLMEQGGRYGEGVLPRFLQLCVEADRSRVPVDIIFIRDYHDLSDPAQREEMQRFGEHSIIGTEGSEFIEPVQQILSRAFVIDSPSLGVDTHHLAQGIRRLTGVDLLDHASTESAPLKVLLVGFHTEKRMLHLAGYLRNSCGIRSVAVSPHLCASSSIDAHYHALKYGYPDALVDVIPDIAGVAAYVGLDPASVAELPLHACEIVPVETRESMNGEQRTIIEVLCMHWDRVSVRALGGGHSGSLLMLADGWKSGFRTEPMVIKIDSHAKIKQELDGYQLVKDLLGKHIPSFSPPVSAGDYSGISMELASMEGHPKTLQDYYEEAASDSQIELFLDLLSRSLELLGERVYVNTLIDRSLVPYRHFNLHNDRQEVWLEGNLVEILDQSFGIETIDAEVLKRIFRLVRKNDDGVPAKLCLSHGDLNLANIIFDDRENIWAIDWTHTDLHPLEIDFVKLENDVKFVVSKQFGTDDFPKLQTMEDYMLTQMLLVPIDELPLHLSFIQWDLRFKKLYLGVKKLRDAYHERHPETDWLVYRIGLLRYSIHSLSFDKRRGRGECGPVQLWYALYSSEQLLFQLVADDFHLKIRGERPTGYPPRCRISIDQAPWDIPAPEYAPPYYVDVAVLENDRTVVPGGLADPESSWSLDGREETVKDILFAEDGKPLNPRGRTGIAGRGELGRWGPNPLLVILVTRMNEFTNRLEILLHERGEDDFLLPEHFVPFDRHAEEFLLEHLDTVFNVKGAASGIRRIDEGYLYDPRQTDNAWMTHETYLCHFSGVDESRNLVTDRGTIFNWYELNTDIVNGFAASRADLIQRGMKDLVESGAVRMEIVCDIIDTSG